MSGVLILAGAVAMTKFQRLYESAIYRTLGASTRILILHTEIPDGQSEKYKALWNEKYITPMRAYFSKFLPDPRDPPVRRIPAPPPEGEDEEDEEDDVPVKGKG